MRLSRMVPCAGLALAVSCASLSPLQSAVLTTQVVETTLATAQDAEHTLCDPTVLVTSPLTHCSGPTATALGLTDAKHVAFSLALSKAFTAQVEVASALTLAVQSNTAPATPPSLATLLADATAALTVAQSLAPASQTTALIGDVQAVLTAITTIQSKLGGA